MTDEEREGVNRVNSNTHPTLEQLAMNLEQPDQNVRAHLEDCLACRIRVSRLAHTHKPDAPSSAIVRRVLEASAAVDPALLTLVSTPSDRLPQVGEVWRVGRTEALLVWVRRLVDEETIDVIPVVLDVDLADEHTLIVSADQTPLGYDTAAMISLRTHLHVDAFLNCLFELDIARDIEEVLTASRESREPAGVTVGPRLESEHDQRLEYRQALQDLLTDLMPSAFAEQSTRRTAIDTGADVASRIVEGVRHDPDDWSTWLAWFESELTQRVAGCRCRQLSRLVVDIPSGERLEATLKVAYLDTAVLIAWLSNSTAIRPPTVEALAAACRELTERETDADAVAVATPHGEYSTRLITATHMRDARQLPDGLPAGPVITMEGHGLLDTLHKYFDSALAAWDVTDEPTAAVTTTNIREIALRHASESLTQIVTEGHRARQDAKKAAWGNLPDGLEESVAQFINAIVNGQPIEEAFGLLALENLDD